MSIGNGGGVYVDTPATLSENDIVCNSATKGGGLYVSHSGV